MLISVLARNFLEEWEGESIVFDLYRAMGTVGLDITRSFIKLLTTYL